MQLLSMRLIVQNRLFFCINFKVEILTKRQFNGIILGIIIKY